MAVLEISDDAIAALSSRERRDLILRLSRVPSAAPPARPAAGRVRRMRRRRIALMTVAVAVLVPWTVYLGFTLPDRHVARNWSVTWVGFDALLLVAFLTTMVFGLLRRQLVMLGAFASGVLLVCDAWFDVTTAGSAEVGRAVLSALLVELPLAAVLTGTALRLLHLTAARLSLIEPGDRLWAVPLPIAELYDPPTARGAASAPVSSAAPVRSAARRSGSG